MIESDTQTESKLILPLHILNSSGFSLTVLNNLLKTINPKEKLLLLQNLYYNNDTKANLTEQTKKIQNQFSSVNEIIRELVANGIDAVDPDNPIGMFGMGGSLGALKLILNPKKTREEIQEMSDDEKSRYYQELTKNKRNTKLVAINKVVGNPINGLIISPQGKTFVMNFDKIKLEKYSENYPDNSTVIAIYPNAETLAEIQKINQKYLSLSEEEFEKMEISELETFKFLESTTLKVEFCGESNQVIRSKILGNPAETDSKTVTVKFFSDHFEVINPSESSELHPVGFYQNLSTKKKEKPENYELESIQEKNPTVYLLGTGNLIIEKNLLISKYNGIPLISNSLTSLKLTLPLSLDASRSEARLQINSDSLKKWTEMLTQLQEKYDLQEFIKILNTLNLYIKNLPLCDPKQAILKTNYLAFVRKLGKETIKKIRDENPEIVILPNLKGFDRVEIEKKKSSFFVDLDFLESYRAENFLNAFYPNPDIFTKNSNLKLVGVDFEFDTNFSWEDFLKIINDTQNFARSFIYTNKLPILGIFDPKDVTKFTQIWLPKTWLVNLETKYSELKDLYEYEIWKKNRSEAGFVANEEKESQLQSLNQMEQEYDKIISVLQIICSPKNRYEAKFIPPIDFKTSAEIKKEVETRIHLKLAKLNSLKNQNSETVATTDEPKSEIQSLKETLLSEITTGKNPEMREVGKTIVTEIFRNVNEGVSDMVGLVLKWKNGYSVLSTSHLFVKLRLPKVQAGHNTENPSVCINYYQEGYDFTNIFFDDLFDSDYHVTLFDLTLPLIKKLHIFKINNRVDTLIKEIVNNIFIPLSDRVEMTVKWNYQNILEHLKNTDAKLYEEYVILTQKLRAEEENLLDFINGARELEHPDLSQIHFKTNKNEAEEEFCRRDLSGYKFCFIGNLTNQQNQKLEVWTYVDPHRYHYSENKMNCSFIAVKNINTDEIDLVDYELDIAYHHSVNTLKKDLEIENNNLLVEDSKTEKFEKMPNTHHVYLIKNNNIPTKKKFSFITYDNNNDKIDFYDGVLHINDKICKENIEIDGDPSGLHYTIIANSPNGYYLLDDFSGSYMDSYRIRFLPIQSLLDYTENSGEVITPITVFEIPQAKIADDGLPVFSDNPFFVLEGDDENTTSILPLKTLIDNFEKNFTEAEKSEKIRTKIQDYSGEVLEPRFEKFSNFVDDLELGEDKQLFLDFCKGAIPLVSFDINDDFQDNETIKKYLDLIKELKTEIINCMKFIKDSDLYSDEFKNFNLLSNLFFRPKIIPNTILILEKYRELKNDPELLKFISEQDIFDLLYQSFFIAGDDSPSILYWECEKTGFELENLKNYLYIISVFEINNIFGKTLASRYYYISSLINNPTLCQKVYYLISQQIGSIKREELKNIYNVLLKINNPNYKLTNSQSKIYYEYFNSDIEDFISYQKEKKQTDDDKTRREKIPNLETKLGELGVVNPGKIVEKIPQTAHLQQKEAIDIVLRELLQNALDVTSNNQNPKIEINRSIVIGSGNKYLENEQNYFHFGVRDNGFGANILDLLNSFQSNKSGNQQGYFGAGFKTVFGIENGVVCIQSCRKIGENGEKKFTKIWLKKSKDSIKMLDYLEIENSTEETFTSIDVYKPSNDSFPLMDVLNFDTTLNTCTSLLNNLNLEITKNGKTLEKIEIEPYSVNKIKCGNYTLTIKTYPDEKNLDPIVYLDNLPVLDVTKLLGKYNLPQWMMEMCQNSSVQFSFELDSGEKSHPLNITRNDFSDGAVKKVIVGQFLAQVFSYWAGEMIKKNWQNLLNPDSLQRVGSLAFAENNSDSDILQLSKFLNQSLENTGNTDDFEILEIMKTLNEKEDFADKMKTQLLRLIRFQIPVAGYSKMNFLEIRDEYQRLLEIFKKRDLLKEESEFMNWLTKSEFGKSSRHTSSPQAAIDLIELYTNRDYEIIDLTDEEKQEVILFENLANELLNEINRKLLNGENPISFKQEFLYTKSNNKTPAAANWNILRKKNKIEISWMWDKVGILNKIKNKKELIDLFIHELSHVLEGILRGRYQGFEDNSNSGKNESHGPEFLALGRLIACMSFSDLEK
jgi:hypothetical protein